METLYRVKSTNEIVSNPDTGSVHIGVTIHWFCDGRMQPVIQYDRAIPQWKRILESDTIDDRQLSYYNTAATYIDQLFTYQEALSLRDILRNQQASEVVIEPISIPLEEADVPFVVMDGKSEENNEYGFIELPYNPDMPIAVPVRGYFDTKYATTLQRYQESIAKSLMEFKTPVVGRDYANFREMVNDFKDQLSELCDSLTNLRNVLDIMSGGTSCESDNDQDFEIPPDNGASA